MGQQAAEKSVPVLIARLFSAAAAAFLVATVALATLLPATMSLHEGLHAIDAQAADDLQRGTIALLGQGIWRTLLAPILVRPVWMVPLFLGVLSIGGALTASFQAQPHTKRRQS